MRPHPLPSQHLPLQLLQPSDLDGVPLASRIVNDQELREAMIENAVLPDRVLTQLVDNDLIQERDISDTKSMGSSCVINGSLPNGIPGELIGV